MKDAVFLRCPFFCLSCGRCWQVVGAVQAVLLRPASRACHGLMAALFSSCKSLSGFRPGSPAASFGRCIDDLENYCMFFRLTLVTWPLSKMRLTLVKTGKKQPFLRHLLMSAKGRIMRLSYVSFRFDALLTRFTRSYTLLTRCFFFVINNLHVYTKKTWFDI